MGFYTCRKGTLEENNRIRSEFVAKQSQHEEDCECTLCLQSVYEYARVNYRIELDLA